MIQLLAGLNFSALLSGSWMLQHERVIIVLAGAEQDTCGGQTSDLEDRNEQFELKLFHLDCEDLGSLNTPPPALCTNSRPWEGFYHFQF